MCQLCQQLGLDLHKLGFNALDAASDSGSTVSWAPQPGGTGADSESPGADSVPGSTGTTLTLSSGSSVRGYVNSSGDQDWYAVTLTAGQTYTFALSGFGSGALSDSYLRLINSSGTQVAFDDDNGPLANSLLTFTASTSGTYYVSAQGYGTTIGQYLLTMATGTTPYAPVVTVNDIADYLTNTYWEVNGGTAHHWGVTTITYNVQGLSAARADLARVAFQLWSEVANLTFVETTGSAQIMLDDTQAGAFASSNYSNGIITSASINVEPTWYGSSSAIDSYTLQTFIHEIGHALGLGHAGPYNGSATYGVDNTYANDTWQYTVMSYMPESNFGGASYRFTMTAMIADILAIQNLYGAPTTRAGDTVYGFGSTAGSMYNFASYSQAPALTIYDSGGTDTLNCSSYSQNQVINLTGGSFSNVGGLVGNICIYTTSVIENAIGGSGADTITGNATDNALDGGAGNDTLIGGVGNDTLYGGAGVDTMIGGVGNDTYFVDSVFDVIVENAGEGIDTVYISSNYAMPNNVEWLYITEAAGSITGVGNVLDNGIVGNSSNNALDGGAGNDTLIGGAGNDTLYGGTGVDGMYGGVGNDTYFVDDVRDVVVENPGEGTDVVYASCNYVLGANVEWLYLIEGAGPITGVGNSLNNGIVGNSSNNALDGGAGNDTLKGGAGDDTLYGGLGADGLYGEAGNDNFVFSIGEANGDVIVDFDGNGAGVGDHLTFIGYGTAAQGATFTQIDATHWQVNSADGLTHEIITFSNAASIHATDYVFV
jgi:serralysin